MTRWMHALDLFLMVVCAVSVVGFPATARAQERPSVEVVSVDREAGAARILVHSGGRVRDINRLARRHATAPGLHVDMDMLAAWNPERIIYVCFDNLPGERPLMNRAPATLETCIGYRSTRWLAAGETYLVPLQPTDAPDVVAPPVATRVVPDPADRRRIASLEQRVTELTRLLADARTDLTERSRAVSTLGESVGGLEEELGDARTATWLVLIILLIAIIALVVVGYLLHKRWQRSVMARVRRINRRWSLYGHHLRNSFEMLRRGMNETSSELAQTLRQQGRLRKRIQTYFVQRQELRKLLLAASTLIQSFQRQRHEDDERRIRIPQLLKTVDDGRRHWIAASAARLKIAMIEKWRTQVEAIDYPQILFDTYDRMIAEYRSMELDAEEPIAAAKLARVTLVDDLYALTGVRTESLDPEARLKKSIEAADKNNELLQAQSEALADLIRLHTGQMAEFHARDEAIKSREAEVSTAEAELVELIRVRKEYELEQDAVLTGRERELKHRRRELARKEKDLEDKQMLFHMECGLASSQHVDQIKEVAERISALEGRTRGLEERALHAEEELGRTNKFLEDARLEFRRKSEIIEAIEKGENHQAKLILQMTAYIAELEQKFGIVRKSVFGDLPAIGYGDFKPKGNA